MHCDLLSNAPLGVIGALKESQLLQIYQNIKRTKCYTVGEQNNVRFLNTLAKTSLSGLHNIPVIGTREAGPQKQS